MNRLKLVALDKDDLEVVSVHLQDAIVNPAEVLWRPQERRVVIGLDRFDWEAAACSKTPAYQRRRAALRFDRVRSCKARDVDPARDSALSLLAVEFDETDAPSGAVTLVFSGKATLRLEVECLEVELVDIGPSRDAGICPEHKIAAEEGRR
ncbi:MAG: DUF2948 family protein [Pseudolabrys sp.]